MRPHPYLRAYMAGIVVPTLFLIVIMTAFTIFRSYLEPSHFDVGAPGRPGLGDVLLAESFERAIVFPMAIVPKLWGAWNMLHLALRRRARMSLGIHGALLPLLLIPAGLMLAGVLGTPWIQPRAVLPLALIAMAVYYLVWKYVVSLLNEEMGIA